MASNINNFAVAGPYRAGTLFLANALNSSPDWTVGHENNWVADAHRHSKERFDHIQERLNHDHYGEVNSGLSWIFDRLDVARKGIILKDPRKCFISYVNLKIISRKVMAAYKYTEIYRMFGIKQYHLLDYEAAQLGVALKMYDKCIEDGSARAIRFDKMVSDPDYLAAVCDYLGVNGVDCKAAVNGGARHKQSFAVKVFKEVEDLPSPLQEAMAKMEWFVNKYELGEA